MSAESLRLNGVRPEAARTTSKRPEITFQEEEMLPLEDPGDVCLMTREELELLIDARN